MIQMKLTEMADHTAEKPSLNESNVAKHNLGESATPEELKVEETRLVQEWNVSQYQRDRQAEYPSTGDQLDYIFHNGVAKWKTDMIEPVKTKYPKPS